MLHDRVYDFIVKYKLDHDGVPPSIREIMAGADIKSSSTVQKVLIALEARGAITLMHMSRSRGIRVRGGYWVAPDGRAGT